MIGPARRLQIEITANRSTLGRDLRDAYRKLKTFERDARRELGLPMPKRRGEKNGLLGNAGKMLGIAGIAGTAFAAIGGISGLAEEAVDYERALTRLQISQSKTAAQMGTMRESVTTLSAATGLGRTELLAGVQAYQALTGDTKGATDAMEVMTRVSVASGASMQDVATAAAALKTNMQIDPSNFQRAFDVLVVQGKAGAIELKDLAAELSSLAPQLTRFAGGMGMMGLTDLGAAFQVVRQGFGNASEASTGMRALMTSLSKHADRFAKHGVQIFDRNPKTGIKTFRGFKSIVDDISRSKFFSADPSRLTHAFGTSEAERAYTSLINGRKLLTDLMAANGSDAVQKDFDTYIKSPAGQIEQALNRCKLAFAEAFTPERIERFAHALSKTADLLIKIVGAMEWLANRPDYMQEQVNGTLKQIDDIHRGAGNEEAAAALPTARRTNELRRWTEQSMGIEPGALGDAVNESRDAIGRKWNVGLSAVPHQVGLFEGVRNAGQRAQGLPVGAFDQLTAAVRKGMAQALAQTPLQTSVKVGAEVVARANKNAPSHRANTAP